MSDAAPLRPPVHDAATLDNWFTYHPPADGDVEAYQRIRNGGKSLAQQIVEDCPPSPERSTALAKVREAIMWANAARACHSAPADPS